MARTQVRIYENDRGWRYYWREGDDYAYMLRGRMSSDVTMECALLDEQGMPPQGSIGCLWSADLFDTAQAHLVAIYSKGQLRRVAS